MAFNDWIDLRVPPSELRCENTLEIGQTFGWTKIGEESKWIGVIGGHAIILESLPETTRFLVLNALSKPSDCGKKPGGDTDGVSLDSNLNASDQQQDEALRCVRHYLRLDDSLPSSTSLSTLYTHWSSNCAYFLKISAVIPGVRILRQDVFETFISFIISQNNNVARITQILSRIRQKYGRKIEIGDRAKFHNNTRGMSELYTFPTISEFILHSPSEEELYELGLGYRAKYLAKIVDQLRAIYGSDSITTPNISRGKVDCNSTTLKAKSEDEAKMLKGKAVKHRDLLPSMLLEDLILDRVDGISPFVSPSESNATGTSSSEAPKSRLTAEHVVSELTRYHGVGRKVAECIALFSCNCLDLVPVDTHVYQLADKLGMIRKKDKTATSFKATAYDVIHARFKERYGVNVGWAHSVLFAGELPKYRKLLEEKYGSDWDGNRKKFAGVHGKKGSRLKSNAFRKSRKGKTGEVRKLDMKKKPAKATRGTASKMVMKGVSRAHVFDYCLRQ